MDLVLERPFDGRWGMLIGATAHKSEGIGGNRGYLANENDQGVIGEIFSDANAETNSRGRLFFERGYVAKWSAMYQLPYGLRGGIRGALPGRPALHAASSSPATSIRAPSSCRRCRAA